MNEHRMSGERGLRLYESIATLAAAMPAPAVAPLTANSLIRILVRAVARLPLDTAEYRALVRALPARYRDELTLTLARITQPGGQEVLDRYRRATAAR